MIDVDKPKEPQPCTKCVVENICELNRYFVNCKHGNEMSAYLDRLSEIKRDSALVGMSTKN